MRSPGPEHPISVTPFAGRVLVRHGERVLADTRHALALHEASYPVVYYIPPSDVRTTALEPSPTRSHCPYKGEACYLSVPGGPSDVAWSYPVPFATVDPIAGGWAFYASKVTVAATAAG